MPHSPPIDLLQAHKWFSAKFFNDVWGILEKPDRTPDENARVISLAHASLAHWRERPDCTAREIAIGCWQISRVYAVLGQAQNARRYGKRSLEAADGEPPFYAAYAHEALARAAKLAGDEANFRQHLDRARELAAQVEDADERQWLETDLEGLD